jgi:hypothetical protein
MTAPSREDLKNLKTWLAENKSALPSQVGQTLTEILEAYAEFTKSLKKAQEMLKRLREAMGILPKSERGKSDCEKKPEAGIDLESLTGEEREQYENIRKKRDSARQEARKYADELKKICPPPKLPEQLELPLDDAFEGVFSSPSGKRQDSEEKQKVERMQEFSKEKGLHSTFDQTKRVDLEILVTDIAYDVETVTDPESGKSVRASMDEVGPSGSQLTWGAIAVLIKLSVGFALPINRVAMMIGQKEFSSGKICRTLRWAATLFLPIYLYLAEELADSGILSGDDTKTKIIDIHDVNKDQLAAKIDALLDWTWPKADGTGDKQALNVSLLMGRSEKMDPRSTIRFFRTHRGSVGNLLTRLLEWRSPKAGSLIFRAPICPVRPCARSFN